MGSSVRASTVLGSFNYCTGNHFVLFCAIYFRFVHDFMVVIVVV